MFLDDGAGSAAGAVNCAEKSVLVKLTLVRVCIVIGEKSRFTPHQFDSLLRFELDLKESMLFFLKTVALS